MSCKSGIYVANTTSGSAIAAGGNYVPNTIVRRYGPSCQLAGNGVTISGAGYYDIDASVTVVATAAGTVQASLYKDGTPIIGATGIATAAAVGDYVDIPLVATVRMGCNCQESTITVVLADAVTTENLALRVEKE